MDPKPSQIDEAPSIGDIVTAKDRVGQVDFSNRLVVEVDEEEETPTQAAPADVSLRSTVTTPADDAHEAEASGFPLILPPARVDAAMAAQVAEARAAEEARLEAEAAAEAAEAAREEARQEERRQAAMDLKLARKRRKEEEQAAAAAAAAQRKAEKEAKADKAAGRTAKPVDPFPTDAVDAADQEDADALDDLDELDAEAAGLVIEGPADLREVGAEMAAIAAAEAEAAELAAAREAEAVEASRQHTRRSLHPEPVGQAPARPAKLPVTAEPALLTAEAGDVEGDVDVDGLVADSVADTVDDAPATLSPDLAAVLSVQEVADGVIAAMRSAQEAHYLHLEALEEEAARRAELLTAQAELDAELIRLNGRREAHAIISAAQRRAGIEPELPDTDPLNEIGETFSRFAESIESTVADAIEIPDHLRKS